MESIRKENKSRQTHAHPKQMNRNKRTKSAFCLFISREICILLLSINKPYIAANIQHGFHAAQARHGSYSGAFAFQSNIKSIMQSIITLPIRFSPKYQIYNDNHNRQFDRGFCFFFICTLAFIGRCFPFASLVR